MSETFTIEAEEGLDQELDAKLRALIIRAVELREAGNFQASFDLLSGSESLVESASESRQGRFFNQRALALKDLKEYDRAILEFDRAAYCFETSGERSLQGTVKNNVARVYSLTGNYVRAHESVDQAISLVTDKALLAAFHDQKAKIYSDEIASETASEEREELELMRDSEFFACAPSYSVVQSSTPNPPSSEPDQEKGDVMPLTVARARELVHAITSNDDAEHAWEILELLEKTSDPKSPIAEQTKRHLFTLTTEFEDEYKRQMQRFLPPDSSSQVEN